MANLTRYLYNVLNIIFNYNELHETSAVNQLPPTEVGGLSLI